MNARLSKAFSVKESPLKERLVQNALNQLSLLRRDTYDEWLTYIGTYYRHFDALHQWSRLKFYSKWRRSREIGRERAFASLKNSVLNSSSSLAPIQPVAATGPPRDREPLLHQNDNTIVAWGTGSFGNRKGSPPLPSKALAKYVARFTKVLKVGEFRTSITCLCDTRTNEYKIGNALKCEHIQRKRYDEQIPSKHWKKRRKWCCIKTEHGNFQYLHPFNQCQDRQRQESLTVIRHRVCPHCSAGHIDGSLFDFRKPWTAFIDGQCERRHDHQAVWHKDVLAAMNMRRIVKHYSSTGQKPAWNTRTQ